MEIESLRERQDEGSISLIELAESFHRLDTSILHQIPQSVLMFFSSFPLYVFCAGRFTVPKKSKKRSRNCIKISLLFRKT